MSFVSVLIALGRSNGQMVLTGHMQISNWRDMLALESEASVLFVLLLCCDWFSHKLKLQMFVLITRLAPCPQPLPGFVVIFVAAAAAILQPRPRRKVQIASLTNKFQVS